MRAHLCSSLCQSVYRSVYWTHLSSKHSRPFALSGAIFSRRLYSFTHEERLLMCDTATGIRKFLKIHRHTISPIWQPCLKSISGRLLLGGFDSKNNQVLICENRRLSLAEVGRVLTHELVHAYDHCTREVDWDNARHLACSEIRAANLTDCSPLRAVFRHFPPTIRAPKVSPSGISASYHFGIF